MMQKKLILFGAGKIGRSFIGQLFSKGGYEVVFVDVFQPVIEALNQTKKYKVIIKEQDESVIWVENVRGVWANDPESVACEIQNAGLIAVSVGQSGLPGIMPLIAAGLIQRYKSAPEAAIDIIIAENLRNAAEYFESELTRLLPRDYPFQKLVGLVETSIGKMVPIMQKADLEEDQLQVFAEAYNSLILDKNGFKNPIPEVEGLAPKDNMKAWVDRKLFIHNLGHAAAAYLGYCHNPGFRFIYEGLDVPDIYEQVREIMKQSAAALLKKYPDDFTEAALTAHIDDLLKRFCNRALGDTIFRVGCDLPRKLSPDDRLVGAIRLAMEMNLPYDKILFALVCGSRFRATDENGEMLPADQEFALIYQHGIGKVLTDVCKFDPVEHEKIFTEVHKMDLEL
jgi:mannitol-1-phosphate 5-dehydrogenase